MKLNVLDLWEVHAKDTFLIPRETLDHQACEHTPPSRLYNLCDLSACGYFRSFTVIIIFVA